jgi:hypothetical protein
LATVYRKMGDPEGALETLEKVMTLEGTRADSADLDKLRTTLDAYEETISEFASPLRAELNGNIERLKNLGRKEVQKEDEEGEYTFETLPESEQIAKQLDAVPIIKFGGQEPIMRVEEEEQTINLDEMEESLEPASVEIEDQSPQSLMSLLDNQKLYDENPAWKDFQLPSGFSDQPPRPARPGRPETPSPSPPPQPEAPLLEPESASATPPPQPEPFRPQPQGQPPGPASEAPPPPPPRQPASPAQDALAQTMQESMRAQARMMEQLAREMRDMYARNSNPAHFDAQPPQRQESVPPAFPRYQNPRPSLPPAPPPAAPEEPVAAPVVEAEAGFPRFARDVAEEQPIQARVPPELPGAAQTPSPDGLPVPEAGEGGPAAELQAPTGPGRPGEPPESVPVARQKSGEEKKDLRQRLRDFLKRIRERLEQRRTKPEPGAGRTANAGSVHHEAAKHPRKSKTGRGKNGPTAAPGPSRESASLVNYLEELTEYLPENRKSSFIRSDARLKIEYIKSKLQGRSGIKDQIERKFAPPAPGAANGKPEDSGSDTPLDAGKIAETFDFMKDLASYHPDKTLGTMLQSKLNAVLHKIRE